MKRFFFLFLLYTHYAALTAQSIKTMVIDTDGKESYYYQALQDLAHSCAFDCDYKNLYSMLESPTIDDAYRAVFFFASPRIVHQEKHAITQDVCTALKDFCSKKNKLIVLLFPNNASAEKLSTLLSYTGLPSSVSAQSIVKIYRACIEYPNMQTGKQYGTSLINKCKESANHKCSSYTKSHMLPKNFLLLPHIKHGIHTSSDHPLAITLYNKETNNIIALMPSADCSFAEVAENFHKNPHDNKDRNYLLSRVQELLWQLRSLHTMKKLPTQRKPHLPRCFTQVPKKLHTQKKPFSAAWLDPKDYYLNDDLHALHECKQKAIMQGCQFLHDCSFNLLWFEVNPEWYFSPMALFKKDTDIVMETMKSIGTCLTASAKKSGAKMPDIFIGSDITSNFNGQKPKNCVYDVFGNAYPNIPSPFDRENVWKQELITPFARCYAQLKQSMPIDGLFLDFEMYHAPRQASSYHDHMDFSECAWQVFKKVHATAPDYDSVADRIAYLKKQKLFKQYFTTLSNEACSIGEHIKEQIHTIHPALRIAIYAPTLPSSWFYRGIIRGLSSKKQPLIMATFNTDYQRHSRWLEINAMHLSHGTALMMSKLESEKDFALITKLSSGHDFVWYNRPSRQLYQHAEKHPSKKWWQAEYSMMNNEVIANGIKKLHAKK